ncbi:MAG: PEP-CTERM sorting domain-containing protein [Cyanobacteria bacterium J06639_1]
MKSILKVSAAVLGSATVVSLLAAPARAASFTQLVDADELFFTTGAPGLFPPVLEDTISLPDAPLVPFDTSLGTLNFVILEGFASGGFDGDCLAESCSPVVSFDLEIPALGISESDGFGFSTGPDPDSFFFPPIPFAFEIAPDPIPLSEFEDLFFGGPSVIPADSLELTIGLDPDELTGFAGLEYELFLTYDFTPVPEPATTAGLLVAGGLGFLAKRKKKSADSIDRESVN